MSSNPGSFSSTSIKRPLHNYQWFGRHIYIQVQTQKSLCYVKHTHLLSSKIGGWKKDVHAVIHSREGLGCAKSTTLLRNCFQSMHSYSSQATKLGQVTIFVLFQYLFQFIINKTHFISMMRSFIFMKLLLLMKTLNPMSLSSKWVII